MDGGLIDRTKPDEQRLAVGILGNCLEPHAGRAEGNDNDRAAGSSAFLKHGH